MTWRRVRTYGDEVLGPGMFPTLDEVRDVVNARVWGTAEGVVHCALPTMLAAGGYEDVDPGRAEEQLAEWRATVDVNLLRDERTWPMAHLTDGEILALLDMTTAVPGEQLPTLDDYTAALSELHDQERYACERARLFDAARNLPPLRVGAKLANQVTQRAVAAVSTMPPWFAMQQAAMRAIPPARYVVEGFMSGDWYAVGGGESNLEREAHLYMARLQHAQPHIPFRVRDRQAA